MFFFGTVACGILVPRPGIEPVPSAVTAQVLTAGLPGGFLYCVLAGRCGGAEACKHQIICQTVTSAQDLEAGPEPGRALIWFVV